MRGAEIYMLKIAFLMPGEILEYQELEKIILSKYNVANEVLEEASDLLGIDVKEYCKEDNLEKLTNFKNIHPLILTLSVASFMVCKRVYGIEPAYAAGYSLGEITALTCSGMITFKDAIKIVETRQKLIEEALSDDYYGMVLKNRKNASNIESIYNELQLKDMGIYLTHYNSPNEIVITGEKSALQKAVDKFKGIKIKTIPLKINSPLHTPLMDKVATKFKKELSKYTFRDESFPVISNVYGLPYRGKASIVENLSRQITASVKWTETMKFLENKRVKKVVMATPSSLLKGLLGNHYNIRGLSFDNSKDLFFIKNMRDEVKMREAIPLTGRALGIIACTKNSNWDEEEYKEGVMKPYSIISEMNERLESEKRYPSEEEMLEIIDLMKLIFKTKKLPIKEQKERFQDLIDGSEINDELKEIIMLNCL